MEKINGIIIIALGRNTLDSILAQLEEVCGSQFDFEGYILSESSLFAMKFDPESLLDYLNRLTEEQFFSMKLGMHP
ncbi:hypothetical protein UF75_2453 [Desulfosporosinus sp. I2]|uniref:hypothetical protein n=1 Tax=Desulfosporosinus sp. I2 TaxID=1617025 RepID=UPI0005EEDE97|nr:hypothetical protein [Desulfosporosinus sp. I2]KJR47156.1 hypothetical protein UF75_2453 [Desulfosporosinus sp. I2]